MTVRHLLSGATLAAAATLLSASSASAQNFNILVRFQPGNAVTQSFSTAGGTISFLGLNPAGSAFTAPSGAQLALFNVDNTSTSSTPTTLTGSFLTSIAITNANNGQTISQDLTTNFSGTVSSTSTSAAGGFPNFSVSSLVYNFSNGDQLTFNGFGFSLPGATGSPTLGAVSANSSSFTAGNRGVAPEPGSLALAATGLMGAMGMVGVRRRRAAK